MIRSRISHSNWLSCLVGLGALLVAGTFLPPPAQAQGPPLEARNLDPTVQPGDTAVVRITIGSEATPVGEVNGVGFQLAFDNTVLTFLDRQVGALFAPEHPGNTLEIGPTVDGSAVDYSNTFGFGVTPPTVNSGEVVRLRFEVKSGAATGSTDLTLSEASRSTSTNPNIPINNLVHGSVTVSETRRAERASVAPGSISEGTEELQFGEDGQLALDYSSLNAETEVEATRIAEPLGGSTDLPTGSGGTPLQRALLDYWTLGQTGASSFTADVCFKLSSLIVSVPDESTLDVYKRASGSDPWQGQTTELRPSASSPTKICATGVGSFSQFTVTAQQGHSRTIEGTDGTGNDTGWRSLALPVSAERISLEDDFDFDVDSGALVQTYDNGQYTGVTDSKTTLERGEGFMLYVFDDAVDTVPGSGRTLDLPESDESQSTSVTVGSLGQNDRFHFLGNPYDVKYSLDGLAGGDLSTEGFQQSVQVWDPIPQPGQFDVVTQGVGDDSIAAWQSFFVQRSTVGAGQTDLTFDPGGRGDSAGDLRGAGSATSADLAQAAVRLDLQVTAESETLARDGLTLLFDERAEAGWDGGVEGVVTDDATGFVTNGYVTENGRQWWDIDWRDGPRGWCDAGFVEPTGDDGDESRGERRLDGFVWPVSGEVTSEWGEDRGDYVHYALDVGAPFGRPSRAPAPGKVIALTTEGAGGNSVFIDHGGGHVSEHHHFQSFRTEEGAVVEQGEIIGEIGSTGASTGPHLHFEIVEDGENLYIPGQEGEEITQGDPIPLGEEL